MRALEDQVRVEFEASLQYILMAAHFDQVRTGLGRGRGSGAWEGPSLEALDSAACAQDTVNLPNLANMFWEHADEERGHAIQFMQVSLTTSNSLSWQLLLYSAISALMSNTSSIWGWEVRRTMTFSGSIRCSPGRRSTTGRELMTWV